jgi:HEPN domain-containing protein
MKNLKLAEKLLRKADQDIIVFKKWHNDPQIANEIIGFHAQQAAEKMLKAVLALHEIEFPLTHRLTDLIDLLKEHDINLPDGLDEIRFLTPFAVEFRYDFYEEENETFDFKNVHELLSEMRLWVNTLIQ